MPVTIYGAVCESSDTPSDSCFRSFLDADGDERGHGVRHQDADVRPMHATLWGAAELASTGG